jgi:hypothetical protein
VWCPAESEAEGFIYNSRFTLQERNKLSLPRVVEANHHGKQDTRSAPGRDAFCRSADIFSIGVAIRIRQ